MRTTGFIAAAVILIGATLSGCGRSEQSSASAAAPAPAASAKPPFGFLNTPTEGEVVRAPATGPYFATGWALADSGIAQVSVIFDDGQKGYVKMGFPFPGVQKQYPTYQGADKAGYMCPIPKMTSGPHSLTVTMESRGGSTTQIQRHFTIP